MIRPTIDAYFLKMARLVSSRGTCARRSVGCVLVSARRHVLATGYNGTASGQPHCIDQHCPGVGQSSGAGLDLCEAVHAEQNALLQARDVHQIHTAYCTVSPCITCTKLLMNTSCERIVFTMPYAHDDAAQALWESSSQPHVFDRTWVHGSPDATAAEYDGKSRM